MRVSRSPDRGAVEPWTISGPTRGPANIDQPPLRSPGRGDHAPALTTAVVAGVEGDAAPKRRADERPSDEAPASPPARAADPAATADPAGSADKATTADPTRPSGKAWAADKAGAADADAA